MSVGELDLSVCSKLIVNKEVSLVLDIEAGSLFLRKDNLLVWEAVSEPIREFCFIAYWTNESDKVLVCDSYGVEVYLVNLENAEVCIAKSLHRGLEDDGGLFRTNFAGLRDGCVFIYESGIIVFDMSGKVVWEADLETLDLIFDEIRNDVIWMSCEHEGRRGYLIKDGSIVR